MFNIYNGLLAVVIPRSCLPLLHVWIVSTDSGIGHVTCSDWWGVSKFDRSKGLTYTCQLDLMLSYCLGLSWHPMKKPKPTFWSSDLTNSQHQPLHILEVILPCPTPSKVPDVCSHVSGCEETSPRREQLSPAPVADLQNNELTKRWLFLSY